LLSANIALHQFSGGDRGRSQDQDENDSLGKGRKGGNGRGDEKGDANLILRRRLPRKGNLGKIRSLLRFEQTKNEMWTCCS